MSSWVSHLPEEARYGRVVGLGMNEEELRRNPGLDSYVVLDLNQNPELPFEDATFDGCGICVSIDYLTRPVAVLRDVGRVLKAGAPLIVSFSNRCFPSKAVAVWHQLDDPSVEEIEKKIRGLSEEDIKTLRDHEKKNKNRKTLLETLDSRA